MAGHNEQGTGKHPHKSTEEPFPHHEAESGDREQKQSRSRSREGSGSQQEAANQGGGQGDESSDLKSREYRDSQGEIHHHTRTYEEQHKGEK